MAHSEDECDSTIIVSGVEFRCQDSNKYHDGKHYEKGYTRGWELTWE